MRYIFIDSNIFFEHWFLSSANFTFLINYLDHSSSILFISELVCDEVQNLHKRGLDEVLADLEKNVTKANTFNDKTVRINSNSLRFDYDFKDVLKNITSSIVFFGYDGITNKELTHRAIKRIMPFREHDKGFRDTLIWLSLLQYLKENNVGNEVIFISNNPTDFYDGKQPKFHPDLEKDIATYEIKCVIQPYLNLQTFIETLPKDEYEEPFEEKLQEKLDSVEGDFEREFEEYINSISNTDFQKLVFATSKRFPHITTILDFEFEIDEGIENRRIISYKRIDTKSVYINYQFELRICTILFGIPQNDYLQNRQAIDAYYSNQYLAEGEFAYFERYVRPKFVVNFIFNLEEETIIGLELVSANWDIRTD